MSIITAGSPMVRFRPSTSHFKGLQTVMARLRSIISKVAPIWF